MWKLPIAFLARRSGVFAERFSASQQDQYVVGQFQFKPIVLTGILATDFEWLVQFLLGDHQYGVYENYR